MKITRELVSGEIKEGQEVIVGMQEKNGKSEQLPQAQKDVLKRSNASMIDLPPLLPPLSKFRSGRCG